MKNRDYIIKAIANLGVAIEFMTWAIESETYEGQIEWLDEAINKMSDAEYWIEKSKILPF